MMVMMYRLWLTLVCLAFSVDVQVSGDFACICDCS